MAGILVVGGAGVLGKAVLRKFAPTAGRVGALSVDLLPSDAAGHSVIVKNGSTNTQTILQTADEVGLALDGNTVSTIVCAAGSWAGGSVATAEGLEAIESMMKANLDTAVLTAHLATKYLKPNGLIVLTGADGAMMKPTPDMIGYGLAKVATHHLSTSLAAMVKKEGGSGEGLPCGSSVVTILPKVIDTPNNRKFMPDSDFGAWSSPDEIAAQIKLWSDELPKRPCNGSFVSLTTVNGKTSFNLFK